MRLCASFWNSEVDSINAYFATEAKKFVIE